MRPVDHGPAREAGEVPATYPRSAQVRDDLFERLGDYCSYCESRCPDEPAGESVHPKHGKCGHPEMERARGHSLPGCPHCHGVKGSGPVALPDFLWPDQDNTFRAFRYEADRAPQVADGLTPPQRDAAERTLRLTGLDREPTHPEFDRKDRRWLKRREAWGIALQSLRTLQQSPSEEMRGQIVRTALGTGFWSIWMTVFADDADMKRRFLSGFAGTANDCFDPEGNPVPREGGRI